MTALAVAAVVAAVLAPGSGRRARLRSRQRASGGAPPGRGRKLALPLLGICAAVAVARVGTSAAVAAMVVSAGLLVRRRHRGRPRVTAADLAVTVDVLAACLASGAPTSAAVAAAAVAAPAEVAATLAAASFALSRGEDPAAAWSAVEAQVPDLAPVTRLCARAATTGAATATELHRIAASLRLAGDVSRRRRLQHASVWLVLPLGLCFLPAFVLVGVVPLVVATLPGLSR